ncbi:hypothetical protein MWU60_01730 [Yoonia sp. F2084L]|uniref:DUF6778 family protein n=1 Tax=Yoonia sp. F2084L TaxID=2926419 RepID=UPI001FF1C010|nr:DUF6778 family protein [Yoonia sp. F2084L]MCK0094276.1 hypothetical protein [Yoonia sp. F2084L]
MHRRTFIASIALLGLAGCGSALTPQSAPRPVMARSYDLRGMNFAALPDLEVSESERFYPAADIVWRGDPPGPRLPQIEQLFQDAAARNRTVLTGDVPIAIDVTLVRFHGVTNRTRYTVGGVYNIVFDLTIRDATTGAVIEPTRRVVGNLDAPGGERAVRLEDAGQTQKVRVTDFLTGLLRAQLV